MYAPKESRHSGDAAFGGQPASRLKIKRGRLMANLGEREESGTGVCRQSKNCRALASVRASSKCVDVVGEGETRSRGPFFAAAESATRSAVPGGKDQTLLPSLSPLQTTPPPDAFAVLRARVQPLALALAAGRGFMRRFGGRCLECHRADDGGKMCQRGGGGGGVDVHIPSRPGSCVAHPRAETFIAQQHGEQWSWRLAE